MGRSRVLARQDSGRRRPAAIQRDCDRYRERHRLQPLTGILRSSGGRVVKGNYEFSVAGPLVYAVETGPDGCGSIPEPVQDTILVLTGPDTGPERATLMGLNIPVECE